MATFMSCVKMWHFYRFFVIFSEKGNIEVHIRFWKKSFTNLWKFEKKMVAAHNLALSSPHVFCV
jgi:hypothetical protein